MKLFRMLGRSIRDAFKSVFRNFSLSLASISCITITLIIVSISLIASLNVENFTTEIEKELTIYAFLDNDTPTERVQEIEQEIKSIKNVESYVYKNKMEIQEDMKQASEALDEVMNYNEQENPLKDSFEIKVVDIEEIGKTADKIKSLEQVAYVDYGETFVTKLVSAFSSIEKVAYGIVIALVVVTVFLIVNTIKLTIFSRQREIGIMRLVGASNFTIKTPFIIEGMILGLIGSIVPVIITTYGYLAFYNHLEGHLFSELIKLIKPEPFIYTTSAIVIVIGVLVGMIGSASAVRKYLKV